MLRFSYCLFVGYWESVLTVVSTYNWVKCSPVTVKVSYVVLNLTGDFFFPPNGKKCLWKCYMLMCDKD